MQGKELSQLRPVAGDDAAEVRWWPWSKRGRVEADLAFDHAEILKSFCRQKLAQPR
jgi:ADP-ribose pyrophosphatase YjhB (NUDIX family)